MSTSCDASGCSMEIRASIGGDPTVTDETVAYAKRDIERNWIGIYTDGEKTYRITVSLAVVEKNPDVLVRAVVASDIADDELGRRHYPRGQAQVGRGNEIELGTYGPGTAAHEFGHLYGLQHRSNGTYSMMSYAHADRRIRFRVVTGEHARALSSLYGRR